MSQQTNEIYEFGSFHLDRQERLLLREGATISLTPKAFDLLLALIQRHGRLVEKEELFQVVWPDTIVEESNLSSNIALIRKALGDGTNGERYIETVPKRGYRFVAEVWETSRGANEHGTDATFPLNTAPVEIAKPRRRFHPLLWVALVSGLLIGWVFCNGALVGCARVERRASDDDCALHDFAWQRTGTDFLARWQFNCFYLGWRAGRQHGHLRQADRQ